MLYAVHLYTNTRTGDFHSFLILDPGGELSGGLARLTQGKDLGAAFMATVAVAKNNNIREVGVHAHSVQELYVCGQISMIHSLFFF